MHAYYSLNHKEINGPDKVKNGVCYRNCYRNFLLSRFSQFWAFGCVEEEELWSSRPITFLCASEDTFVYSSESFFPTDLKYIAYWDTLRDDLRLFPEFSVAAKRANLSHEQAVDLLFTAVKTQKHEERFDAFDPNANTTNVLKLLTNIFDRCVEKETGFTERQIEKYKELLSRPKSDIKNEDVLYILEILRGSLAAWLPLDQGFEIVDRTHRKVCDIKKSEDHYSFEETVPYHEVAAQIYLLAPHNVSTGLFYDALLATIDTEHISRLADVLYAAVSTGLSQEQAFTTIANTAENREDADKVHKEWQNEYSKKFHSGVDLPAEDYFPDIGVDHIVPGILPYRIERSWQAGIHDLRSAIDDGWQVGAFIFDPDREIWYSLGGHTHHGAHEFFSYDASKLSKDPCFVCVHPRVFESLPYEVFYKSHVDFDSYPKEQRETVESLLEKTLYVLPGGLDYRSLADLAERLEKPVPLKGYFVTSHGLTEVQVPSNAGRISDFRDNGNWEWKLLRDLDITPYLGSDNSEKNEKALVSRLIAKANENLPEGFKIELCSYDDLSRRNNKPLLQDPIKKTGYIPRQGS